MNKPTRRGFAAILAAALMAAAVPAAADETAAAAQQPADLPAGGVGKTYAAYIEQYGAKPAGKTEIVLPCGEGYRDDGAGVKVELRQSC